MARKKKHSKSKKKTALSNTIFRVAVFVVLVAIVAAIIMMTSKSGQMRVSDNGVVATVNGEDITEEYLGEQYDRVPVEYKGVITKSMLLNQTINEILLLQEAEKRGIGVTADEIKQQIDDAMLTAGMTDDQLDERLAAQNISREFLEDLYMKQLTINALLDDVVSSKITITDGEIEGFYESRIRAMHVLVDTEDEAYAVIDELKGFSLNSIESGFAGVATEKSKDPSAATNGGDLGEFGRGQMVPEFEQAAFALDEYAFTAEPIQSQFGYHVILKVPKEQSLEEQYSSISEFLLSQKKAQAMPLYIEQIRSKADVEVFFKEEAPAQPEISISE